MRHFASIGALYREVTALIDGGRLDKALRYLHDFVERIVTEPLCTSQIFGSKALDELCQRIGRQNLLMDAPLLSGRRTIGATSLPSSSTVGGISADRPEVKRTFAAQLSIKAVQDHAPQPSNSGQPIAYIATKLQKSGGHTRVILDFMAAQPNARHVILLTGLEGRSDIGYLQDRLRKQSLSVVIEEAHTRGYQNRLSWLQQRLLQLRPAKTYLFNHHQDSVAASAVQPEMELPAAFYHHGDHHLCLGVFLPHLTHIDPHPMGYHNCRDKLGVDNVYIPLSAQDQGPRSPSAPFLGTGSLTTCTAARSNKVEIPYFASYLDLVPRLLSVTGGKHVHLGQLTRSALRRIRSGLAAHGVPPERFVYNPWVPSVWKSLHEYQADLYVASFPYGGGLTLIEAMGAGLPVVLHNHIYSRVLSSVDLAYPGAFVWRQPEELLDYCTSLTADQLHQQSAAARRHFEQYHLAEHLPKLIESPLGAGTPAPPLTHRFDVNPEEWALWMERRLKVSNMMYRTAYRALRRLRSRLA